MTIINKRQVHLLNMLMRHHCIIDERPQIVSAITRGRTDKLHELRYPEARVLIRVISKENYFALLCLKIIDLALMAGVIKPSDHDYYEIAESKVEHYLYTRGAITKKFACMTVAELLKAKYKLEGIIYQQALEELNADADVTNAIATLLFEMGITLIKA